MRADRDSLYHTVGATVQLIILYEERNGEEMEQNNSKREREIEMSQIWNKREHKGETRRMFSRALSKRKNGTLI